MLLPLALCVRDDAIVGSSLPVQLADEDCETATVGEELHTQGDRLANCEASEAAADDTLERFDEQDASCA